MWAPLAYTRPESQRTDLTSLFSADREQNPLNDYQYQINIRELEDYYNKTILNEDNIQETGSEISSAVSFSPSKQKDAIQPGLLYDPQLINPFLPSADLNSSIPTTFKKKTGGADKSRLCSQIFAIAIDFSEFRAAVPTKAQK
ncbi:Tis11p [Saccharomyces cerevisiae x Saccharomyces kudriavzevii VIN7]|uniref:Tis11p n=1 Tax=Saccharomyces cerevisiae x Saccharomyces kudriavzevii (strain VIN7) TaxID=1095631 RepID=H0GY94_SACCK|nr:Tis11p [Saccharomyces cerevisiae x Saccharomyces kudriavzevii VIN7]